MLWMQSALMARLSAGGFVQVAERAVKAGEGAGAGGVRGDDVRKGGGKGTENNSNDSRTGVMNGMSEEMIQGVKRYGKWVAVSFDHPSSTDYAVF